VAEQPNKQYTHEDVALILRDGIANKARDTTMSKEELVNLLEHIEIIMKPIEGEYQNCLEDASVKSSRIGKMFAYIFAL
jgi:hypothetical protein